MMATDR